MDSDYPARNIPYNIADIKAQIAANQAGINEIHLKLIAFGEHSILKLSKSLLRQGELFVRKMIPNLTSGAFETRLDTGQNISVNIVVDKNRNDILFDFVKF